MKKTEYLESAVTRDGTPITLCRHDGAYSIRVNNVEWLSTRRHNCEDKLAALVCAPIATARAPRVLVDGLGLGFTLRAALGILPADATMIVAEPNADVIRWNENPEYALAHHELSDRRVRVRAADVWNELRHLDAGFDAIVLGVSANDASSGSGGYDAYDRGAMHLIAAALRARGRVACWSASEDNLLAHAMREADLDVQVHTVRAHVSSGPWHVAYVGQRR